MLIEKISMKNFRQYVNAEIMFSTSKDKNVTLIWGVTGAGKTSLFYAFNWCLYGVRQYSEKTIDVFSKNLIKTLNENEVGETKVEIVFKEKDKRYVATRSIRHKKSNGGLIEQPVTKDDFTLSYTTAAAESVKEDFPEKKINTILPENVRTYFLFDGEKIDEFSKIGQEEEIKESMKAVLGLEVLNRAMTHLNNVRKRYSDELSQSADSELKNFLEIEKEDEEKQEDIKTDLSENNKELMRAKSELDGIIDELKTFENIKGLVKERNELKESKKQVEEKDNKLRTEILDEIDKCRIILAAPIITKAYNKLDESIEEGKIPTDYNNRLIETILKKKECICTTPIKEGSKESVELRKLLEDETLSRELQDELIKLHNGLGKIGSSAEAWHKLMNSKHEERSDIYNDILEYDKRIQEITEKIGEETRDDKILELEEGRNQIEMKIDQLKHKQIILNRDLELNESSLNKVRRQIRIKQAKSDKDKENKEKRQLTEDTKNAIEQLHNSYAEEKRKEINRLCQALFKKLVWKSAQFTKVELNETYGLNVLDRYDLPARADLSAGERQILSLAFIVSMAQAAGKEAPFIIDTPFSRISKEPRENIATNLPSLTSQLILFVTDVELTPKSEKLFREKTNKEYTLVFDDNLGITEVQGGKHVQ